MSRDPTPDPTAEASAPPTVRRAAGLRRAGRIPTPLIFVGSVSLAAVLLWRGGQLGDIGDAVRRADAWSIAAGLALYLAGLALLCFRWHVLVQMVRGVSSLPRAAEAFLTSVVINYAAPIGLAVPTRAALTKRALGLSTAETGAVAIWEVGVDVIVLGAGSMLWLSLGGWSGDLLPSISADAIKIAGGVVAILATAGVGLALAVAVRRPALLRRIRMQAAVLLTAPIRRPGRALVALGVGIAYWIAQGAVMWLLLRALGERSGPDLILGLTALPILVGMLSPVPGGAGVREALMLGVARVQHADGAAVLLAALTYRVALFVSIPVLYAIVRVWLAVDARAGRGGGRGTIDSAREAG